MSEAVAVPSDPYLTKRASLAETPGRQSDLKDALGIREAGGRGAKGCSGEASQVRKSVV